MTSQSLLSLVMLALSEQLMRSVKLSSPAALHGGSGSGSGGDSTTGRGGLSDSDDEEDGVIQPEQSRSHQLIATMLSSSPPQPSFLQHTGAASSSASPDRTPNQRSSSSTSPASPASPSAAQLPTSAAHHSVDSALPSAASRPAGSAAGAVTRHPSRHPTVPPSAAPPVLFTTTVATVNTTAAAPEGSASKDNSSTTSRPAAAASALPAVAAPLGGPRIVVTGSSTLSADMFSKSEVLSPPPSAGKSSLASQLSEFGLFRVPTRPYSASANTSPALPPRSVRDDFTSTGPLTSPSHAQRAAEQAASNGAFSSASQPATVAAAASSSSASGTSAAGWTVVTLPGHPQHSASARSSPAPPSHRRTRSRGHTTSSSVTVLRVFPAVDRPPMQLLVPIHCPVSRVLEMCVAQYRDEGRQPPLRYDSFDAYELRVLDDDDGTPDEDMPPLDRYRDVQEYGVDAVAILEIADYQPSNNSSSALVSPNNATASSHLKASTSQQAAEQRRVAGSIHPAQLQQQQQQAGSRWDEVGSPRSITPQPLVINTASGDSLPASRAGSNFSSPMPSMPATPTAQTRGGAGARGKVSLKVTLADNETHLLSVAGDSRLEDLLPLISRRKSSQMQPEHWKFVASHHSELGDAYGDTAGTTRSASHLPLSSSQASVDSILARQAIQQSRQQWSAYLAAPELDMHTPVSHLTTDDLRLINKLDTPRRALLPSALSNHSSASATPHPDQFLFSADSASAYSEYRVVKTNQRGKKQHRMFGIDRHKVYNKLVSAASGHRRRISFEVTRAYRSISSIHAITQDDTPQHFTIVYEERGGKLTSRQYETETRMECAEVVAKVRFLMQLAAQEQSSAGSGGGGSGQAAVSGGGGANTPGAGGGDRAGALTPTHAHSHHHTHHHGHTQSAAVNPTQALSPAHMNGTLI